MARFVIHKKGFFYTDEAFEADTEARGTVIDMYDNPEAAIAAKIQADIESIQNLAGENVVDFFFYHDNYDSVYKQLETLYKEEFDLEIEDQYHFYFPDEISETQADKLLAILGVSFHDIVEYEDDEEVREDNLQERDLGEF